MSENNHCLFGHLTADCCINEPRCDGEFVKKLLQKDKTASCIGSESSYITAHNALFITSSFVWKMFSGAVARGC